MDVTFIRKLSGKKDQESQYKIFPFWLSFPFCNYCQPSGKGGCNSFF